jgi:hypothetical protein
MAKAATMSKFLSPRFCDEVLTRWLRYGNLFPDF